MTIKNPLRYPGAKSKLYDYIYQLLIAENKINLQEVLLFHFFFWKTK